MTILVRMFWDWVTSDYSHYTLVICCLIGIVFLSPLVIDMFEKKTDQLRKSGIRIRGKSQ